ncbi:MAG: acyltransferase [Burkholderiales bacterium]|nr:acyltransferase [Burkholderiales bacterium]
MGRYLPQIDGLRAVAVSAVVIDHCFGPRILVGGHIGVDIFFVISGFLITGLLVEEIDRDGRASLRDFYLRRFLRIMPALLGVSLFVVAALLAGSLVARRLDLWGELRNVLYALASIMNWARAAGWTGGGFLGHAWSLSVEEQFYLVWPLLLNATAGRLDHRRYAMVLIGAMLALAAWRGFLAWDGASADRLYNGTDTRADGLLLGAALALSGVRRLPAILLKLWPVPVLCLAVVAVSTPWSAPLLAYGGFTLVALCAAWLVALAVDDRAPFVPWLKSPFALWIGKRSYSLYLWHYPILMVFSFAGVRSRLTDVVTVVASLVAAHLSYRLIEQPFLRLKGRFQDLWGKRARGERGVPNSAP